MAREARNNINATSSRFHDFCETNPSYELHFPASNLDSTSIDHLRDRACIPPSESSNHDGQEAMDTSRCCCGRDECAYLQHNNVALGGLERDLETAAKLGQALLHRHESYVKESQEENNRLSQYISNLETERTNLQNANERFVAENRDLLAKLQTLNADLLDSGKETKRLEDLLQECESEVRRLNGLSRRTEELEDKILRMEKDREELCKHVEDERLETKSTLARWKESERRIRELEDEVQKIEWEARLEREKHEEIMAKMERERSLERELGVSEGRLKATAAVQSMSSEGHGTKAVVSNFVRDILQDNANLQAGIAELRELLHSSNEEVQNLRDQVLQHQPVQEYANGGQVRSLSLGEELELGSSPPKQVQSEVHVHHHYHAKVATKAVRPNSSRKPLRRRAVMPSSAASTVLGTSTPTTPLARPQRLVSSPITPINLYHGQAMKNRWSMQSNATISTFMSSMASSPRSYLDRNSSIFDRIERDEDSSRPTSPESVGMLSPRPQWKEHRTNDAALCAFTEETHQDDEIDPLDSTVAKSEGLGNMEGYNDDILSQDLTPRPNLAIETTLADLESSTQLSEPRPPDIAMLQQKVTEAETPSTHAFESPESITALDNGPEIRPSIRRRNSCDSLVSISGMDIHLAQRPAHTSTLTLLRGNSHHFSTGPSQTRKVATAQPLTTVTEFTATSRHGQGPNHSPSILALSDLATTSRQSPRRVSGDVSTGTIGKLGKWVQGKWGVAPTKSVADLRSASTTAVASVPAKQESPLSTNKRLDAHPVVNASQVSQLSPTSSNLSKMLLSRSPGINQSGSIPGFASLAAKRAPTEVSPKMIDVDGLKDSLES